MASLRPGDPRRVGPYRLERRLGGTGRVFLGRSRDGRPVAVRVVRGEPAGEAGFRRRFAAEARAARRVVGPRTARVLDADPAADPPWLATAYVPGPSLRDAVRERGPLPPAEVTVLGAGLTEGLAAIHGAGIAHGGLTPDDVILAEDGPLIVGFGAPRARDAVGSPPFLSPEQAGGGPAGPPGDVFSLASVLVFAATGRGPFGDGPGREVLDRVVHGDPDLIGLPAHLAEQLADCLAKEPADRPAPSRLLGRFAVRAGAERRSVLSAPDVAGRPRRVRAHMGGRVAGQAQVVLPWLPGEASGARRVTVTRWRGRVGDTVAVDDPLLEVSTGRDDVVITSPAGGTLSLVRSRAGDSVRTGHVIALVGAPGTVPRRPSPLERIGGVAVVALLFAIVALTAATGTSLFAEDARGARPGDCVAREYLVNGDVADARWLKMPCALIEVRAALSSGSGYSGYYRVVGGPSAECRQWIHGWSSSDVAGGASPAVLCLREI
ncbi:biotin carboxyl carrier protein [Actinomadura namibiensis]|uniref:Biotin carboxyl carrier protein n=1 Tax=Actinomadura namibiensis TaxID=182080 RepID=A0A7W3LY82_ACTNM|nr:serine/threonine-protein kinase [Actinomadura namibiensis]MBA8956409.1 biotin carboxyl carrier protein [Actinomadura namibiensis]